MSDLIAGFTPEALAAWNDPEEGPAGLFRSGRPSRAFWAAWRSDARALARAGIALLKADGAWLVRQRLASLADLGKAEPEPATAVIPPAGPAINEKGLLPWQIPLVRRLAGWWGEGQRTFLDASDTGTGKTYTALGLARETGRRVRLVAPKAALFAWARAAGSMGVELVAANYEHLKRDRAAWVRWNEKRWPVWPAETADDLFVFDEAHRCKAAELTLNAKLLMAARWQNRAILMLSATLATSPLHLRAAGYALGLHDGRHFSDWARGQGCVQLEGQWFFSGRGEALRTLHARVFSTCGVRVRHADLKGDFPETQIDPRLVDFGPAAQAVYAGLESRLAALRARTASYAAGAFTELLAARQEIELIKTPAVARMAEDSLAEGNSVVLFFNFREPMRHAQELLGIAPADCIEGGQPAEFREKLMLEFQADRRKILCVNLASGGVAVSLHGRAFREALLMPTYAADTLRQALGRVHRAGGGNSIQRVIFAAGTVEEGMAASLRAKLRNLDLLNDGDVALPFTLHESESNPARCA